ncbi:hypothetical protein [Caballeronia novacaledonica]|uniref:ChrR-like cupin domain-containing protein n=1 Tax=Caballeronia novacaledonica TaxID=1544861 RepID=A0AA37IQ43_9BURK|nr:hypothetical protein [Caballeronia novacaledonica]GJH31016.1 hypothetical protein CBA19CS42_40890 [Caballeronia novacaledonica]
MQISDTPSSAPAAVGTMREGVLKLKFLLTGKDDDPSNYAMFVSTAGSGGWTTPRHRHNFDQLRYVVKGTYPYASGKVMHEGWVGYFPESVRYGPQERPEGLEMITLQFGGASGSGYLSVERREAANKVLQQKGEFKDGIFTYFDEHGKRHNQDGSEACFEQATGQKVQYAKPRYEEPILMDPSSYEWVPEAARGVSTKWLGSFTERELRVGFTRVETESVFHAGEQASIELLYLAEGEVQHEGRSFGPGTAFEFAANEGPVALKALSQNTFYRVILPIF